MKGRTITIRRWMYYIVGSLSLLMLVFQLLFQSYFVDYVGGIYLSNMDAVMEQVAGEVQDTFTRMNDTVAFLAENTSVVDYTRTAGTAARYGKAYEVVRPIVQGAVQNLGFDHVLISDITGAWYLFEGQKNLSIEAGRKIKAVAGESGGASNSVQTLDGVTYFCTIHSVTAMVGAELRQVGLVVALTDVAKTRDLLLSYGASHDFAIQLHDHSTILVGSSPDLENQPAGTWTGDGAMITRDEVILPGTLEVVVGVPQARVFPQRAGFVISLLGVGSVSLVMLLAVAWAMNRLIVRPFSRVAGEIDVLGDRDLSRRLTATGVAHVDELVRSVNGMLDRLEDYSRRAFATQQNLYELELDRRETQMYLLRNQIDRHFLYNSLISIKTLADRGETAKVEAVAGGIAQLLRYTTSRVQEVNLFDELEVVQRYVNIQNIRFSGRIETELEVDDRLCEYRILKLLVQPLVENALIHGLESRAEGGTLTLRGQLLENAIRLEVEDNGAGIPPDQLARLQQNLREASTAEIKHGLEGVALVNIQKRIQIAYGEGYGLTLESEPGVFTRAVLFIPAIPDQE